MLVRCAGLCKVPDSLTESGLTLFPFFCSGAIPGQSQGHASWRFPLAASAAGIRIPLPSSPPALSRSGEREKQRHEMPRLQLQKKKTRQRPWIPDQVGDDRRGCRGLSMFSHSLTVTV